MELDSIINGRLAITPGEALYAAGMTRSIDAGKKTARNKLHLGTFPFPTIDIGGHRVVKVADLLNVLGLTSSPP